MKNTPWSWVTSSLLAGIGLGLLVAMSLQARKPPQQYLVTAYGVNATSNGWTICNFTVATTALTTGNWLRLCDIAKTNLAAGYNHNPVILSVYKLDQ